MRRAHILLPVLALCAALILAGTAAHYAILTAAGQPQARAYLPALLRAARLAASSPTATTLPTETSVQPLPPTATGTTAPTATQLPPTTTQPQPTATQPPPTATDLPPTATDVPPTATDLPPTATDVPPTNTIPPPPPTSMIGPIG